MSQKLKIDDSNLVKSITIVNTQEDELHISFSSGRFEIKYKDKLYHTNGEEIVVKNSIYEFLNQKEDSSKKALNILKNTKKNDLD